MNSSVPVNLHRLPRCEILHVLWGETKRKCLFESAHRAGCMKTRIRTFTSPVASKRMVSVLFFLSRRMMSSSFARRWARRGWINTGKIGEMHPDALGQKSHGFSRRWPVSRLSAKSAQLSRLLGRRELKGPRRNVPAARWSGCRAGKGGEENKIKAFMCSGWRAFWCK